MECHSSLFFQTKLTSPPTFAMHKKMHTIWLPLFCCAAAALNALPKVSLNAAVTNAKSGDTIYLEPIVYSGSENCNVQIRINLSLISSGGTVIDCELKSRCLVVSGGSSVTVVGVTLRKGKAFEEPLIRRSSTLV